MQASNITVNTVLSGSADADTIENYAGGVQIYAGDGNDLVLSSTTTTYTINGNFGYVTVDGGNGDDSIAAYDPYMSVNGGAGNDLLDAWIYSDVTIRGGSGNDTIQAYGNRNVFEYEANDGDDSILGFNSTDTIRIAEGVEYSTVRSGNDMIISIGSSKAMLADAATATLNIVGGVNRSTASTDTANYTAATILTGTRDEDTLVNYASDVTIDARAGDDVINNLAGDFVLINAGDGDDSIFNQSGSWYNTVNGGTGDDTITPVGTHMLIQYKSGDGDDVINEYVASDTISIIDGADYQTLVSGNDVIISIGSGSITLKEPHVSTPVIVGGTNRTPNVEPVDTTPAVDSGAISNTANYTMISGTANADSIFNFGSHVTIDAGAGNDVIGTGAWYVSINGGAGNDSISVNDGHATVRGGAGNDSIELDGGQNVILYAAGDGNDIIDDYDSEDTIRITDGTSYATMLSGENVIVSIGSGTITLDDAVNKKINVVGGANRTPTVAPVDTTPADTTSTVVSSVVYVSASSPTLNNNRADITIVGSARADSIKNNADDVTIRGGTGNDTIELDGNRQVFLYSAGDGADVIDDYESTDTIRIVDSSAYQTLLSGDDVIVSIGSGSITLDDAADKALNIFGGSNVTPTVEPVDTTPVDTTPTVVSSVLYLDATAPTLDNSRAEVTIVGSSSADSIVNSGARVSIGGGAGNDTILTSGANTTLNGGAGSDRFGIVPNGGSIAAVFTDISTEDTIAVASTNTNEFTYSIGGGALNLTDNSGMINLRFDGVTNFNQVSNVNVALQTTNGNNRYTSTLGSLISTSGGDSVEGVKLNKKGTTLTLKKTFDGTLRAEDYGDNVQTIKTTAVRTAVNIVGNDLDNKITVGKYGSTVEGGGGDDLIKLGKGVDVVVYADGDGDDTIKSYKAGDKIQIVDGAIDSVSLKGSTVKLNVGDGSLTIKSVVKKELTIIDADGVESTYKFTKQNNDLDSARISTSAQLSSEDYWFEDGAVDQSPLSDILSTEAAIDLSTGIGSILDLNPSTVERLVSRAQKLSPRKSTAR